MKLRVRSSVVVVHNQKILCFFAIDPTSGKEFHFLPGGAIEKGETAPDAAVRETKEETGFDVRLDTASSLDREYPFHWDGQDFLSHTIFYRGFLINPFQKPVDVKDASYNHGVRWVPISDLEATFGYTAEILDAIKLLSVDP